MKIVDILHLCVTSKSNRIALKLLQNGADTSVRDINGRSPLDFAISKGQDEIRETLEESKKCQLLRLKVPLNKLKKNISILFVFLFFKLFP